MSIEKYYSEGLKFIKDVKEELGENSDLHQSERIMASVLHTLREVISPEESLHLIAQLPVLIKGIYVHNWHIRHKKSVHTMDDFMQSLMSQSPRTSSADFGNEEKAKQRTKAIFRVLRNHVTEGEIKDIVAQLPPDLRALFIREKEEIH